MKEIILYLFLLIWSLICFYFEFSSLGYWSILLYATLLIYDILIIYNFSKIKNSRLFVNIKKKRLYLRWLTNSAHLWSIRSSVHYEFNYSD